MNETAAGKFDAAALVVFSQTDKGGRHAAWFTAPERANARKAAALNALTVIEPIPDELTPFLPKIARGRFVMGQISLPKADATAFAKMVACAAASKGPDEPAGEEPEADGVAEAGAADEAPESGPLPVASVAQVAAPANTAVPTNAELWQRIRVGDTVLAPYEGWWKARVLAVFGDTVRLGWQGGDDEDYDEVPRSSIALLFPRS